MIQKPKLPKIFNIIDHVMIYAVFLINYFHANSLSKEDLIEGIQKVTDE